MAQQNQSSIKSLDISEDKKEYIMGKISPMLEDLVTDLLTNMPDDPVNHCATWFANKCGSAGGEVNALQTQNDALRHSILAMAQDAAPATCSADDESEEEESDDDEEMEARLEAELAAKANNPQHKCNRTSVSAEAYGQFNQKQAFTPPVHAKTDEQMERLEKLLASCWFFNALGKDEMKTVLLALQEVTLNAGDQPITKGDYGDFMFVIETGTLECHIQVDDAKKVLKRVVSGEIFGELALLYNTKRAANVSAETDCKTWKLDRDTFTNVVVDCHRSHREKNMAAIKQIGILNTLDEYQCGQVCDALKSKTFKTGETIITQGEVGNHCFFVIEGCLHAEKNGENVKQYGAGQQDQHFGELALLNNAPRAASVICDTDVTVMELSKDAFRRLLGDLVELLRQTAY